MSEKDVEKEDVVVDEVAEKADDSVEKLFDALCDYMQIEPQRNPDTFIATSIGSMEYACVIARQCGVNYSTFMEAVNNVWRRGQDEGREGSEGQQDEKGLDVNITLP